jgi:serine/threonine protein kinase
METAFTSAESFLIVGLKLSLRLHSNHLIHNSIKPSNFQFQRNQTPYRIALDDYR